jgi:hypothetical protein
MRILIYSASFLCGTAGLIIAFWYVLRTGNILKGILIGYVLSIVCVFMVSIVLPGIVALYKKEYSLYFPEAIGVPAVIFTGWLPVSVVVIIAGFVRHITKRFWTQSGQSEIKKADK